MGLSSHKDIIEYLVRGVCSSRLSINLVLTLIDILCPQPHIQWCGKLYP
jgi:hypothetical protein